MKAAILVLAILLSAGCRRATPNDTDNVTAQAVGSAKVSSEACRACQAKHCSAVVAACTSKECLDVHACISASKCADAKRDTLVPCYCGTTEQDDCFFGKVAPNGPCKAVIETGARSTSALEIGQRYFDMAFPAGQAIQLATCEQSLCKQCQ